MNVNERLNFLLKKLGWTRYRLSKESDLSEATLTNIFHRGSIPTIDTLEKICDTMNISLADFFADGKMVEMTPDLKVLYENWLYLSPEKRNHILKTMEFMK